jgi:hypothetical protein
VEEQKRREGCWEKMGRVELAAVGVGRGRVGRT